MSDHKPVPRPSARTDIDTFLKQLSATPKAKAAGHGGRLIFSLDATASRKPTWDQACRIQAQMFEAASALGGLEIQLCYYRGVKEFVAMPWCSQAAELQRHMIGVTCLGGYTQIGRLLQHVLKETRQKKIDAVIFVGDCMEENVDHLCQLAGELGLLGVPLFLFHEGHDAIAEDAFRQIARLSNGAYCRFDSTSAGQLRELLNAVAVYAAGGRKALENYSQRQGGMTLLLTQQLKKSQP